MPGAFSRRGPVAHLVHVDTPEGAPAQGGLGGLEGQDGEHADAWLVYLEEVIGLFADLLEASRVGVRLIVSDAPHCPRFHVDQVPGRAVLTVLGAGTEWFEDTDIDRGRLGHAGGPDDAVSGLVGDWNQIQRAAPGTLAVFKGKAWPGAEERSIVHRSPPPDGNRRVLLTFDWLA